MFWNKFYDLCHSIQKSPNGVAKEIGVSSGSITSWKNGKVPHHDTLIKISNYFGVSVDYLLGNTDKPTSKKGIRIPVYGNVAAGIPMEAITDIEDYEEIDEETARKGEYAALRIHGESMEPRMCDGDVVIVRLQEEIESGETAIVIVNGQDATCKKIKKTPEGIMLIPINPSFDPIFYTNKQIAELPVRIFGKVVELRGKF